MIPVSRSPDCVLGCQHARDIGMTEYRCQTNCRYLSPAPLEPFAWRPHLTSLGWFVLVQALLGLVEFSLTRIGNTLLDDGHVALAAGVAVVDVGLCLANLGWLAWLAWRNA